MDNVAFQCAFFQPLQEIHGNKEYAEYRGMVESMDKIICATGLDLAFADSVVEKRRLEILASPNGKKLKASQIAKLTRTAVTAYRCAVLKLLTGRSFRELSVLIAESLLLQWFCRLDNFNGAPRIPSKSTLQRYEKMFDADFVGSQVLELNRLVLGDEGGQLVGRILDSRDVFIDGTCMKAKMHFPVDWILLKDCAWTVVKAILLARRHGMRHRIKAPEKFLSELNSICMSIASLSKNRRKTAEKKREFRKLKSLCKVIAAHGERYLDLLKREWSSKTDLSEAEAELVAKRLEKMLALLPVAMKQAHSRMISGKQIANDEKLLSVYHESVNVMNRGKASGNVEFGNALFIAEQSDGLILDWKLYEGNVKDPAGTKESISRLIDEYEYDVKSVTGDRGCQSKSNDNLLAEKGIFNALAPRNPLEFAERMVDEKFRKFQKRRGQTEGRIGILKNTILDGSLYERDFVGKELKMAWAVLTHNLWVLARIKAAELKLRNAA
jgi:hypothetical protein